MALAGFYFRLLDLLGVNEIGSILELIFGFEIELSLHFPNSKIWKGPKTASQNQRKKRSIEF